MVHGCREFQMVRHSPSALCSCPLDSYHHVPKHGLLLRNANPNKLICHHVRYHNSHQTLQVFCSTYFLFYLLMLDKFLIYQKKIITQKISNKLNC